MSLRRRLMKIITYTKRYVIGRISVPSPVPAVNLLLVPQRHGPCRFGILADKITPYHLRTSCAFEFLRDLNDVIATTPWS